MKILLLELDGKIPNHALMRISAHHQALGDDVTLRRTHSMQSIEPHLGDRFDKIYASGIFEYSLPLIDRLKRIYPHIVIGGSAFPKEQFITLESIGIITRDKDYSLYPAFKDSLGYTQRGCRLSCSFCRVPWMEGKVSAAETVEQLWRGNPYPRNLLLLDNDFFGHPEWRNIVRTMRDGGFKVCFNQGINARLLNDEACEALASLRYYDDQFKTRRLYTAWDNRKDEHVLFSNLQKLEKYGVNPEHIMVYMLIGYWPGETHEDRDYRRAKLRTFGARPYPMAYQRTAELRGFQRWVIGAYDKRVNWQDWENAKYEPRNLNLPGGRDLW